MNQAEYGIALRLFEADGKKRKPAIKRIQAD